MTRWHYICAALLAALFWPPAAAWAYFVRLTAPYTIDGTTWPAGTYVPVDRDGQNDWVMRNTTTSPRIPKSISQLVPLVPNRDNHSVGIDDRCWSYKDVDDTTVLHPSSTMFDPADVKYHQQPYTTTFLLAKEGDAYIIKMRSLKPGPDEVSRIPLHCVTFLDGHQFKAGYSQSPLEVSNPIDDAPFTANPWIYGLAGGIAVLIAARFLIYGRG